jgi:hypothetical protein
MVAALRRELEVLGRKRSARLHALDLRASGAQHGAALALRICEHLVHVLVPSALELAGEAAGAEVARRLPPPRDATSTAAATTFLEDMRTAAAARETATGSVDHDAREDAGALHCVLEQACVVLRSTCSELAEPGPEGSVEQLRIGRDAAMVFVYLMNLGASDGEVYEAAERLLRDLAEGR